MKMTRLLALKVRGPGIIADSIDPGWVRTDMGTAKAALAHRESVSGITHVVDGLTVQHGGLFLRYDGSEAPW
jgi:NAD(P)-dependent dehydrogenase (short-subunit alcohol dehydrogenase family)